MEMFLKEKEVKVLVLLSPSKTMDMAGAEVREVSLSDKTVDILNKIKTFSEDELSKNMKVKGKTLESVKRIYSNYDIAPSKKAIEAYSGFVFKEIHLDTEEKKDFVYNHFMILSALYGAIMGDTYIKEYRLDMLVKVLENPYKYWKEDVNNRIEGLMKEKKYSTILNLASNEFSKLLDRKRLEYRIVDVEFKENKDGVYKAVSTYAKKARGLMSNFIIDSKNIDIEVIKKFNLDNYSLNEELSSEDKLVFTR